MAEVFWKALRRIIWIWLRLTGRWPLVIALDLDGVVDETFFARFEAYIRDHVDTPVARALDGTGFSFPGGRVGPVLGITAEEGDALFPAFLSTREGFNFIPSRRTKRSIRRIWLFGQLHLVTRRDIGYWSEVLDLLRSAYGNLIEWGDVHWSFGNDLRKGLICDAFNVDVIVDDQPDYIANCTRQWGLLFGRYKWTEADAENVLARSNVVRACDWSQVLTWCQRRRIWKAGRNRRSWVADPPPRWGDPSTIPTCSHDHGSECFCWL